MTKRIPIIIAAAILAVAYIACDDLSLDAAPVSDAPVGSRKIEPAEELLSPGRLEWQVERVRIPSCRRPQGLALDRRGRLYAACSLLGEIQVIDPDSMSVLETWGPFFEYFFKVDIVPGEKRVAAIGMNGSFFHLFNMQTGRLSARIKVGKNLSDMRRVPHTSLYLVSATNSRMAALVDAENEKLVREIHFPAPVGYLAVGQSGRVAAATGGVYAKSRAASRLINGRVYIFDPQNTTDIFPAQTLSAGRQCREPVFVSDDTLLLAPNYGEGTVSVFDVEARQLLRKLDVQRGPERIIVGPDGRNAYCLNRISRSVSVINLSPLEVIRDIKLPAPPEHALVSPDGSLLVVTLPKAGEDEEAGEGDEEAGNYLALIDLAENALVDLIPAGGDPAAMTQSSDGRRVFVSNFQDNSISIFR